MSRQLLSMDLLKKTYPDAKVFTPTTTDSKKLKPMYEIPLASSLRCLYEVSPIVDKKVWHFPLFDNIAPPTKLIFPQEQPKMTQDTIIIRYNFEQCVSDLLACELGIDEPSREKPHICPMAIATGDFRDFDGERKLFLKRHNVAEDVIIQFFWLSGQAPREAGLGSTFAKRHHAVDFYRIAATDNYCGSDFWRLKIGKDSCIYEVLDIMAQNTDQAIQQTEAKIALQKIFKQKCIKSGLVKSVNELPGWSIDFNDEVIVLKCIDNFGCGRVYGLDYVDHNAQILRQMVKWYRAGTLNLETIEVRFPL